MLYCSSFTALLSLLFLYCSSLLLFFTALYRCYCRSTTTAFFNCFFNRIT